MCTGPARAAQEVRLGRAEKRESGRFVRDYNDRLFNGLVIVSLAQILLFRFVIRISLLETLGWLAFAFLQVTSTFEDCLLHCSILTYWTFLGDWHLLSLLSLSSWKVCRPIPHRLFSSSCGMVAYVW